MMNFAWANLGSRTTWRALSLRGFMANARQRRRLRFLRLRSEFVTFSKLPKIDAANKAVTTTKSSKIQKGHKLSGRAPPPQRKRGRSCHPVHPDPFP